MTENAFEKPKVAGVIGYPIGHSKSPKIHSYWLKEKGIDGYYIPLPVEPKDFDSALRSLPKLGFSGVNVTVPYKISALKNVDYVTQEAKRIGAVNTVVVQKDGALSGYNTDAYGFIENIRNSCPDFEGAKGPALVIGAGGAARAVCVALQDAGVPEIRVTNRTPEKAKELVSDLRGTLTRTPWEERSEAVDGVQLVVNATSLGMQGQPSLEIEFNALSPKAIVTDLVYAPLKTDLLRRAAVRGNRTVDGLGMLLHQARPAFEAFYGEKVSVTGELRTTVLG